MKISTNSWHYKLMEKVNIISPHKCNNLCDYIKDLLITFIIPIWLVTSPAIAYIFLTVYVPNDNPPISEVITGIVFLLYGISGVIVDLFIIFLMTCKFYILHIQDHLSFLNRPKKEHHPNIFIEYLKVRKQKMCPLVEFEE